MFENPRRDRQARNFTINVAKILDLKSSSEQIFSENCRWVPLYFALALSNINTTLTTTPLAFSKSCKLLLFISLVSERFLYNSSYVREREVGGRCRGLGKIRRKQAEYLAN